MASSKSIWIEQPNRCAICARALAVGDEALWYDDLRTLTCLGCTPGAAVTVDIGRAGASARREHERRRAASEQRARNRLGPFGVFLARIGGDSRSTRAWRQGADGEVRTAQRLEKLLRGTAVRLLHDRRVPGHGRANIDHIAVGPAGVLVIDSKTHRGRVKTERVGGLFSPRRTVLRIGGRDQTKLIDGVERQLEYVRIALGNDHVALRGVLCFPSPDGLPLVFHVNVRGVGIRGPRQVARLASAAGPLSSHRIEQLWRQLAEAFPSA